MFFAYLATLWFGCSNAAQEIVKEIAIYRRERLVGVGAHSYLASKFIFLTAITTLQALLLYVTMLIGEGGRDGSVALADRRAARHRRRRRRHRLRHLRAGRASVMQAVMIVPLILIPQIIFSGYTVPPSDMSRSVLSVSRLTPTFCAQTIMDTSFLWQQKLSGDLMQRPPPVLPQPRSPSANSRPATSSPKNAPPSAACSAA